MLRRLHPDQPESFAFSEANRKWAEAQIRKYPEGRQASAIIPLLWRAQEQEGWLSRPAIEHVCDMLDMAHIRGLEVATFYFMFQLQPVGSVANIQICGTLSCMICGAEDLVGVCKEKIAANPHTLSADGKFSWEEVECLGACANAPMAQIGKDYYEDLTTERLAEIIDELGRGEVPVPGPQNGRFASEPLGGLTSLRDAEGGHTHNGSVSLALEIGDTVKRIDGTEVPLRTPWIHDGAAAEAEVPNEQQAREIAAETPGPRPSADDAADKTGITEQEAEAASTAKPPSKTDPAGEQADAEEDPMEGVSRAGGIDLEAIAAGEGSISAEEVASAEEAQPEVLDAARDGGADDLKRIVGVGPKLEGTLNELGIYHFDQIAAWGPAEVAWVDARLSFKGRIVRDNWIDQARALAG